MARLSERARTDARPDARPNTRPDVRLEPRQLDHAATAPHLGDAPPDEGRTDPPPNLTFDLFGELCLFAAAVSLDGRVTRGAFDARRHADGRKRVPAGTPLLTCDGWGSDRERRASTLEAVDRAARGETVRWERSIDGPDGTGGTGEFQVSPIRRDGCVIGLACTVIDVTDQARERDRQDVVARELTHRIKNVIAQVQGVAALSLKGSVEVDEARDAFLRRLHAIAAAQDLLTSGHDGDGAVSALVERALAPFGTRSDRVLVRQGEDAILTEAQGLLLCLALNELGTNALKHGALSNGDGRVELGWTVEEGPERRSLLLAWKESGGPPVVAPGDGAAGHGFGTTLLQRVLRTDDDARCELRFDPEGVRYRLAFTLKG